jgi:hypothetical protein
MPVGSIVTVDYSARAHQLFAEVFEREFSFHMLAINVTVLEVDHVEGHLFAHYPEDAVIGDAEMDSATVGSARTGASSHHAPPMATFTHNLSFHLKTQVVIEDIPYLCYMGMKHMDAQRRETEFDIEISFPASGNPAGFALNQLKGILLSSKSRALIRKTMHDFEIVCDRIILHKQHKSVHEVLEEYYYVEPPPVAVLKEDVDIFDDDADDFM